MILLCPGSGKFFLKITRENWQFRQKNGNFGTNMAMLYNVDHHFKLYYYPHVHEYGQTHQECGFFGEKLHVLSKWDLFRDQ